MEGLFWFVYEMRERKAVRVDVLVTEQAALEAAGLSDRAVTRHLDARQGEARCRFICE